MVYDTIAVLLNIDTYTVMCYHFRKIPKKS